MKIAFKLAIAALLSTLSGCFLTKVATVPLRVGAAVVSIVPVVGNEAHDAIDVVAEKIDEVPI